MPRKMAVKPLRADPLWTKVDRYFGDLLAPSDEKLDAAAGLEENRRFHADLVALGGNPFLSRLLPKLQIHVFRIGPHNPIATSRAAWVAGHEEILNAIIAGQPAAAEAHLRRYVLWIRSIMVELPYKEEIGGSKS